MIAYLEDERTGPLVSDRRYWLSDGQGNFLANARITASWKMPLNCWVTSRYYQVEATIEGIKYTGRSAGPGMSWRGRPKARQE